MLSLPDVATLVIPERRRVIVELAALEKTGKTHFALTGPAPLLYGDFNKRAEGTIEKFIPRKEIRWARINQMERSKTKEDTAYFYELCTEIAAGKHAIRTVVIDAWDELRDNLVLVEYNRPNAVPHEYKSVNRKCRELVEMFKSSDVNLILVTQLRKETKGDGDKAVWTGNYERKGLFDTGAMVHVVLQTDYDPVAKIFSVKVEHNGYNERDAGTIIEEPLCTFPLVMANLVPDTSPADWS